MDFKKTPIACVNYLNTQPFLYGLANSNELLTEAYDLKLDTPSNCAKNLIKREVALGLVPVASLLKLPHYEINTDYCIGSVGKVDSVLLVSEKPIGEITHIQLDYQSNTSVALCRLLCREFWKINPQFISTESDLFIDNTKDGIASVIIGNRALVQFDRYPYQYDLSESWYQLTGLPFVFAVWASIDKQPEEFIQKFNSALAYGVLHVEEAIQEVRSFYPESFRIDTYLRERISYTLDDNKMIGLETFLKAIR